MREAQAEDWLEDLGEFPAEIVEVACRQWRRSNRYRPTPFDIRVLAIAEQRRRNPPPEAIYSPVLASQIRPPEDIAHAERMCAEAKRILADAGEALSIRKLYRWQDDDAVRRDARELGLLG